MSHNFNLRQIQEASMNRVRTLFPNATDIHILGGSMCGVSYFKNNSQEYVLKLYPSYIDKSSESLFLKQASEAKKDTNTPKVFEEADDYIVMEYLSGSGDERNLSENQKHALYRNIGAKLSIINSIVTTGFGYYEENQWHYNSWDEFILTILDSAIRTIHKKKPEMISKLIKKNTSNLAHLIKWEKEPMLLHGDPHINNFIYDSDLNISGVIDPGWIRGGDPLIDLAQVLMPIDDMDLRREMCNGYYGKGNDEESLGKTRIYEAIMWISNFRGHLEIDKPIDIKQVVKVNWASEYLAGIM